MGNSASQRKIYDWPISKDKLFHILSHKKMQTTATMSYHYTTTKLEQTPTRRDWVLRMSDINHHVLHLTLPSLANEALHTLAFPT